MLVESVLAGDAAFFVFPLQLQTDFQLRAHSPYNDQREAITEVITSFANHASRSVHLVVKVHPLDNGLIDWRAYIEELATRLGIGGRVQFLDGGDLNALLAKSCWCRHHQLHCRASCPAIGKTGEGAGYSRLRHC